MGISVIKSIDVRSCLILNRYGANMSPCSTPGENILDHYQGGNFEFKMMVLRNRKYSKNRLRHEM